MSSLKLFQRRFSCRSFAPDPIPRQTLTALLEAARWAPNGGNLQPWRFVVVEDAECRAELAAAAFRQRFLADAPAVIVVCAVPEESGRRYGQRGRELYCLQDTAAAAQSILLAATDLGLGTCWVGAFDEAAVAQCLNIDRGIRPVALIPVGTPTQGPGSRSRLPLDAITSWR